ADKSHIGQIGSGKPDALESTIFEPSTCKISLGQTVLAQHTIARHNRSAWQIAPVDLRQVSILDRVSGEEEFFELPLPHHHHFDGARSSAAFFSITRPAANRVSS